MAQGSGIIKEENAPPRTFTFINFYRKINESILLNSRYFRESDQKPPFNFVKFLFPATYNPLHSIARPGVNGFSFNPLREFCAEKWTRRFRAGGRIFFMASKKLSSTENSVYDSRSRVRVPSGELRSRNRFGKLLG
jgi:hypothetical protein